LLTKQKVDREPKQTNLGNERGTTMRPVVAKITPKKQNTIEDKTVDAEEVKPDI
jgi:hypothetical protein